MFGQSIYIFLLENVPFEIRTDDISDIQYDHKNLSIIMSPSLNWKLEIRIGSVQNRSGT